MKPAVVITGTSSGIGLELARQLARDSQAAVVGISRDPGPFEAPNFVHIKTDLTDEKQIVAAFAGLRGKGLRPWALVNNAGVAAMCPALLVPTETFSRMLQINTVAASICMREASKLMMGSGGRIVNLTTVAVPLSLEGEAPYVASKAALEALTRVWAKELSSYQITVNAVGPGPVLTRLIEKVPAAKLQKVRDQQVVKRELTADDVVNVVEFLLHPRSSAVSGQIIYVGGVR
jgi:3-oxoacyl-[acyl-carrier protein] reductase